MFKIEVKKTVEAGKVTFSHNVPNFGRDITGHTCESGTIVDSQKFWFGEHVREWSYADLPAVLDGDTPVEYAEKLLRRLETVQAWVKECRAADRADSGSATVFLEPTLQELISENAVLRERLDVCEGVIQGLEAQLPYSYTHAPRLPARGADGKFTARADSDA